jgi:hypothetical protein
MPCGSDLDAACMRLRQKAKVTMMRSDDDKPEPSTSSIAVDDLVLVDL